MFGKACYDIAERQTSFSQARLWLQAGVEAKSELAMVIHAAVMYSYESDILKGDEAALVVSQVKDEDFQTYCEGFDPSGSRARRCLVRTLLCGSLKKNQESILYRSFFRSRLREVHLLPLVAKFLAPGKKIEEEDAHLSLHPSHPPLHRSAHWVYIYYLVDIARLIFDENKRDITHLCIRLRSDNHVCCFLPLLLSRLPHIKSLKFEGGRGMTMPTIDLSFLVEVDTSKLEELHVRDCTVKSLSPLSLCNFSSLQELSLGYDGEQVEGLQSLEGLTERNTRSLKRLQIRCAHLKDISALSNCNLSRLESLKIHDCYTFSDISPLRGADLSSLGEFFLSRTKVSDLSPLCECKGFVPRYLCVSECPIKDLSAFVLLKLNHLSDRVSFDYSELSSIAPLERIPYDGIVVDISGTLAAERLEEDGLESPHLIGKVTVEWESW